MLTILPDYKSKKTFHVVQIPTYLKSKNYYFPEMYAAALALRNAKINNCDEINIEVDGMRPLKFTTLFVEEQVRKNPLLLKFSGLDREYSTTEKIMMQHTAKVNSLYL